MRKIPQDAINSRLISQLVASAGSIGANYSEAGESESKKDFVHKILIAKKEIKESMHWIRILATANENQKDGFRILWKEAHELLLIFSKIISSSKKSKLDN